MKLSAKRIVANTRANGVFSYNTVDSTNKIAKELAATGCDEGVVICALKQTAGKGRLGRTFLSKNGGVYFSLILRPKNNLESTVFITTAAAVAAARAIEGVSDKNCAIKWVNDVYIDNKKVCGILTEGGFDANSELEYAVLGVGINLFAPKGGFPASLPLAGSVFDAKSKLFFKKRAKEDIIIKFLNEFAEFYNKIEQKQFLVEYKEKSFLTGRKIKFIKDGAELCGKVEGINDDAHLIVTVDGETLVLAHGEIQIVGMEQLSI